MPLTNIEYGSLASSEVMNDNFSYLDNRITAVADNLSSASSSINSNIASLNSTFSQQLETITSDISSLDTSVNSLDDDIDNLIASPNYTQGISINSFPYTALSNGYVFIDAYALVGSVNVYVNNTQINYSRETTGAYYSNISSQFRVNAGDEITFSGYLSFARFFPLKGGI